jgi:hypothetical protein
MSTLLPIGRFSKVCRLTEPAGACRETYLVGGPDAPDPATWRTEVSWPIRR